MAKVKKAPTNVFVVLSLDGEPMSVALTQKAAKNDTMTAEGEYIQKYTLVTKESK